MRRAMLLVMVVAAGCGTPDHRAEARAVVAAQTAIAAESAIAALAAARPSTGRWDRAHLVERLVRAGLAPQALPGVKAESYWGVPVLAYRVGSATLYAHLFADSVARRRVTSGLDSLTAAPVGTASPYPAPRLLLVQNNLAAVLVGGNERQQERVAFAVDAGLAAP